MKKNVVFWVGVKNEKYSEKYGGWDWMDITRKSWEYWCKKHDVIFFPMEKPIKEDLTKFRINWQKAIYCFDILDDAGIDYDQIYLVDGMNIILKHKDLLELKNLQNPLIDLLVLAISV